jgi:hypothetical protein
LPVIGHAMATLAAMLEQAAAIDRNCSTDPSSQ